MISNRIKQIKKYIPLNQDVADVGSDHGLLLRLLFDDGFPNNMLGIENKEGPFSNLSKLVKAINDEKVSCILSDGIDYLPSNYKTVVIAGMGFDTIKAIINKNKDKIDFINDFIIDCHTSYEKVRPFFVELGYHITEETIIFEDNIYYEIIHFKKGYQNYTALELTYGPINLAEKSEVFINRNKLLIEKNELICSKRPNSDALRLKINELKQVSNID